MRRWIGPGVLTIVVVAFIIQLIAGFSVIFLRFVEIVLIAATLLPIAGVLLALLAALRAGLADRLRLLPAGHGGRARAGAGAEKDAGRSE